MPAHLDALLEKKEFYQQKLNQITREYNQAWLAWYELEQIKRHYQFENRMEEIGQEIKSMKKGEKRFFDSIAHLVWNDLDSLNPAPTNQGNYVYNVDSESLRGSDSYRRFFFQARSKLYCRRKYDLDQVSYSLSIEKL